MKVTKGRVRALATWKKEAFTTPRHALSAKTARQNRTDAKPFAFGCDHVPAVKQDMPSKHTRTSQAKPTQIKKEKRTRQQAKQTKKKSGRNERTRREGRGQDMFRVCVGILYQGNKHSSPIRGLALYPPHSMYSSGILQSQQLLWGQVLHWASKGRGHTA